MILHYEQSSSLHLIKSSIFLEFYIIGAHTQNQLQALQDSKDYTTESGLKAVQHYLDEHHRRGGGHAKAAVQSKNRFFCQWQIPKEPPSVELIIPTRDQAEVLKLALNSIITKTSYTNYAITIVDNQSTQRSTKKLFKDLIARTSRKDQSNQI